jgi:aryl-alcohol dehydrogenase-like predicted oxidoreductase
MNKKLILGTAQLGLNYGINNQDGKPSLDISFEILHAAYDRGVRVLDTAEAYGDAQEIIGDFHKDNPEKQFKIITKFNADNSLKESALIQKIKHNCVILHTAKLYGYMFHNYHSFIANKEYLHDLLSAKENGLIEKIGISLYNNQEVLEILENYTEFDFIQIPFNLFDNDTKRKAVLLRARDKGIEIHTRSVFLQGLFFMSTDKLPENLKPLAKELEVINVIKYENNLSTEVLALKYVLEKEYIDFVLIGVESVKQLISNVEICNMKRTIPHGIIDKINIKDERLLNPSLWNKI